MIATDARDTYAVLQLAGFSVTGINTHHERERQTIHFSGILNCYFTKKTKIQCILKIGMFIYFYI
jgi:hypothetical protein